VSETFRLVLVNCEATLLREIADKEATQRDVAKTYRLALDAGEEVSWGTVNRAIIARWSASGLRKIKTAAWTGSAFKEKP
jgi:hypothetical protein